MHLKRCTAEQHKEIVVQEGREWRRSKTYAVKVSRRQNIVKNKNVAETFF